VDEEARELTVTLYGTRANTDIINYAENDTLLQTVEWRQVLDDRAQLDITLRQPLYGYLVLWEDGNFVLRVRRRPAINGRNPLRGLTITVDPGHPPIGATGPTGLYEAQAVLPIGEKVRELLEQRGARGVMTRTTNDPVDLGLRPIIARRENANAFVSIHLNAYGDGVNPLAARNGSGTYFFHALSEPLARPVEQGLVRHMGLPNLGVYYDNLAVVRGTWMPMVLTEGAFVIIPEQEAALRTPEFQARYAQGIVDGLEEYFRWLASQP
jgi:N-acetylmuramoyl-L-alanine amidase